MGVAGLTDVLQEDLFAGEISGVQPAEDVIDDHPMPEGQPAHQDWLPGLDVEHDQHGRGWVWGSGLGRVTVRFEDEGTPPGPVRTFGVRLILRVHRVDPF